MSNESNRNAKALLALVKEHAGGDFVRELLTWAAHQIMEAEVGEITDAGKGERTPFNARPRDSGMEDPKRADSNWKAPPRMLSCDAIIARSPSGRSIVLAGPKIDGGSRS